MRIILFGDVVGRSGRTVLLKHLPKLKAQYEADFCVANAENAAGGSGLTVDIAKELLAGGVDVITLGDHAFRQKDYHEMLALNRVVRPSNAITSSVGVGFLETKWRNVDIAVINLQGQTFSFRPARTPGSSRAGWSSSQARISAAPITSPCPLPWRLTRRRSGSACRK